MINKTLSTKSLKQRNDLLNYRIRKVGGKGTREAVVAAARYLSEEENIPYFWGGKYSAIGINKEWNTLRTITSTGSDIQIKGDKWLYGLDCSGFVTWAIINGGYKMEVSYTGYYLDYIKPKVYPYTIESFKSGNVKAGDLLFRKGHIAIITYLDLSKDIIKVAEEKGAKYGMVVTKCSIENFVEQQKYTDIYLMEDYYNNKNNLLGLSSTLT